MVVEVPDSHARLLVEVEQISQRSPGVFRSIESYVDRKLNKIIGDSSSVAFLPKAVSLVYYSSQQAYDEQRLDVIQPIYEDSKQTKPHGTTWVFFASLGNVERIRGMRASNDYKFQYTLN
eukprot:CAMPEP_0170499508 /NCGR_PEP_ID=MMETSP0208-20121228/31637_1 /TAXON_ID=197538 /ORGANISM="Strombidium inclinatum, Strain S3" /LENGTH=119 /DNA_ID=CAMNT_0010777089 /DNA_START=54 /DNA_END=413 /DNA_ORIENTATION=-